MEARMDHGLRQGFGPAHSSWAAELFYRGFHRMGVHGAGVSHSHSVDEGVRDSPPLKLCPHRC